MLRPRTVWLAVGLAVCAAGCRGRTDLVEAELRLKDRQLRDLAGERERLAELNEAYSATIANGPPPVGPGLGGHAVYHVKDVQVGRGTGGLDEDKCPGDEGILVVIVPRDSDDTAIKAPGSAHVSALQITPEGLKTPLCSWDVTPGHLRRVWKTGLLSTGYFVALPFETLPFCEKVRVIVQFRTPDGAMFEAERDVQLRLGGPPAFPPTIAPIPPAPIPAPGLPPPITAPIPDGSPSLPPPVPATSNKFPAQLHRPESRPPVVIDPPT